MEEFYSQGVLPNKEVGGGLGPHIKFGDKIWGKVRPSSPSKRKNLGSSVTTRRKSWGKVPILGSYLKFRGQNLGYLSFIFLEAKFGAPTRISEAKFGAKPPDLLIWKYPPGILLLDAAILSDNFPEAVTLLLATTDKMDLILYKLLPIHFVTIFLT